MLGSGFWRRLSAIVVKEVQQLRRDRLTFAMMFGVPIMQLLLFGYAIDTDPHTFTVANLSTGADSYTSSVPNPERIAAGDGPDTITDRGGADLIQLGPGADVVDSRDGISDTIDCTGGGADTAAVDLTPAESYVGCPDADGGQTARRLRPCSRRLPTPPELRQLHRRRARHLAHAL